jgi:hypothetical protein
MIEHRMSTHEGVYCLSTPALVLEPTKATQWSAPHPNAGWDT